MAEWVKHEILPVYDKNSRILILGTIPSPKSREAGFYYSHPQNRFWRVLAGLFSEPVPKSAEEKKAFVLKHKIALWDVLAGCEIEGAADDSIKNPTANDLSEILGAAEIRAIFTTGTKAAALYKKYCLNQTKIAAVPLPSTSPANCRRHTFETLLLAYRAILPFLEEEAEKTGESV